jgi:ATP-binding cassette subfamily B protein
MALGIGAYLFLEGTITIGAVYLIFHYTRLLQRPIESFTQQLDALQKATASIIRVMELLHTEKTVHDGPGVPFTDGALSVKFEDVSFAYNDGKPVLHGLSFELTPGRVLGVIGPTGAGKTTLTRLLFRLYDPDEGRVLLGGRDIRGAAVADLRWHIGMVTQDVRLFHGTVRDNLTFFDQNASDRRLLEIVEDLGLSGWLRGLPNGLDTELQPDGGGLSAGEAQLLAFTRVFLKDPGVVVLDEASSRLDRSTEQLIERALDRLAVGRTVIVIAHHLVTVQRCDEIIILEDGSIVEQGDRAQLAGDPGARFHRLLQAGLEEVPT